MLGFEGNHVTANDYVIPKYTPLYEAAWKGDWETARALLEADQDLTTARITWNDETLLHAATHYQEDEGCSMFLEKLMELMPPEALELKDKKNGYTALHKAAMKGYLKAAKVMVTKNPNVTQIRDKRQRVPLLCAASYDSKGQKDTVEFLCTETGDEVFSSSDGVLILLSIIYAGFYDIALSLVQRFPKLVIATTPRFGLCALGVLAQTPYAFLSGCKLTPWQRGIYSYIPVDFEAQCQKRDIEDPPERLGDVPNRARSSMIKFLSTTYPAQVPCIRKVYEQKLMHKQALDLVKGMCKELCKLSYSDVKAFFENSSVLKTAISFGTVELVEECLLALPSLYSLPMKGKKILEIAVEERNEKIVNFLCSGTVAEKKWTKLSVSERYKGGNTILHIAAHLAPSTRLNLVSGAALQMQCELLWFKEVENLLLEKNKLSTNSDGNTAQVIFTEEHMDLVEKGEKWMKDTANSCMLVAALIATVAFTAAFTVPGGNISDSSSSNNGSPIFLHDNSFIVFAIADALSLFSSITSILMFLSILTSRYAEQDFLKSLPNKLIIGLSTLFISIATMMVAFGAALSIVLGRRLAWVIVPIIVFSAVPVTLFAFLQFPLFLEMVYSTYFRRIIRYKS